MNARARMWRGVDHLRVFGPFEGITAEGLRAASAAPVLEAPPDADAVTRLLIGEPLGERPLVLATGGGYVGARIAHTVGDGRVVNTLFPALIRAAVTGTGPRPPVAAPVRLPLICALLHHFGRHPAALLRAGRISRPPRSSGVGAPWTPDIRYRSVRSATALGRVRAWRDRYAPGLSAAAVLFSAAPVALTRAGLPPKWPGAVVLVDARRYLPDGATVDGNFSWGQYVCPADPIDPRSVHAALAAELDSGRPLAMLALRTARLALRSPAAGPVPLPPPVPLPRPPPPLPPPVPVAAARQPARPELTLTHVGRLDGYADLPWAGPPDGYRNISVPTTSGPEALTLSFSELAGALYVNASFDGAVLDSDRVAAAIDALCHDPVGLVSVAGG